MSSSDHQPPHLPDRPVDSSSSTPADDHHHRHHHHGLGHLLHGHGHGHGHGHEHEHEHRAHHISEFGEVDHIQHIDNPVRISEEDALPAPPVTRRDRLAFHERMSRLRRRLFHERHLHQYFYGETLYRTEGNRSITPDELFLDLVIVGGIAALGHELRENFNGWRDVEKFFLLFGAVYSSWRNCVFLWNLWGVASDLIDKIGIFLVFTSLTFIALGAHGAFDKPPTHYVAAASFVASALPILSGMVFAIKEPLLRNGGLKQIIIQNCFQVLAIGPYLIAAFLSSDLAIRILFWISIGVNAISVYYMTLIIEFIKNRFTKKDASKEAPVTMRMAIAIELMVEKFDVLTMIVLGESVLGILFEGALYVTREGVRLGSLFGAAAAGTAMLYSLQTLYNNVDAPIAKGGKHAIRYRKIHGLLWSQLHLPYHAALVLFATGFGISLRDVSIRPPAVEGADHAVNALIRAGEKVTDVTGPQFGRMQRWLFSVGWGASIILSGLIGALHLAGPRAATKRYRFIIRAIITTGVMVGMPFANIAAEYFIAVFTAVLVVIALVEYIFVQMDRMGFFRSELSMFSTSMDEVAKLSFDDDLNDTDSPDKSGDDTGDGADREKGDVDAAERGENPTGLCKHMPDALKARLCKSHRKTMVAASVKNSVRDLNARTELG